ncbi:unnamed protein product, partial [Mesorhabditis spiculigera]
MKPLLLLLLAVLATFALAEVYQHKLIKIESRRRRMMRAGTWRAHLQKRAVMRALRPHRRDGYPQKVYDWDDEEYLGNITIGTPEQPFRKDGWPWEIEYGTGSADGFQGIDTVRFGEPGTKQLVVPSTTFGQAEEIADFFADDPIDGILGLAFTAISVNDVTPPLVNAINLGVLTNPIFTVFLMHQFDGEGVYGGVFTYGDLDKTNCGDLIAYQTLSSATYWEYKLDYVSAGGFDTKLGLYAISDTGTSFIGGPQYDTDKIAAGYGATWNDEDQVYEIDCKANLGPFAVTIGGIVYNIQKNNMIVPSDQPGNCWLALFPFDSLFIPPQWILGDPFIRQYCHTFDYGRQRIGFSPSLQK